MPKNDRNLKIEWMKKNKKFFPKEILLKKFCLAFDASMQNAREIFGLTEK